MFDHEVLSSAADPNGDSCLDVDFSDVATLLAIANYTGAELGEITKALGVLCPGPNGNEVTAIGNTN